MTTLEERVEALERQYLNLRVPPVREEVTNLRDVHGARLAAIEARLGAIEHELFEETSWIERRFTDMDNAFAEVLSKLPPRQGPPPTFPTREES